MRIQQLIRSSLFVGVIAVSAACAKAPAAADREATEVALPQKPDLKAKTTPEKYDDGTLTVTGVVKNAAHLNGNSVKVRGKVIKVDTCTVGEVCSAEASVMLADDSAKSSRVLTVMDPSEGLHHDIKKEFPLNALVTVEGKISMWSPTGRTINMDGILLLDPPKKEETEENKEAAAK
jgi:hypothetical protein